MEIDLVVDVCVMDRVPDVEKKLNGQYAQELWTFGDW